ncbi:MAG: U32 family peptidase [Erysipelotrichales bacterium]|nr:U32 family peptidase [Erysipelotrichales bacterium]
MRKPELLAPAGNTEALRAAIQNGADAVYLGGKNFGARAFSDNFSEDELKEALDYVHSYGAKLYVTLNTILSPGEFEKALEFAGFCNKEGVDAVLVQDFGLATEIHRRYPDLPLHSSTQMHIHNKEGLEFLKEQGFERAVLAREVSLAEIDTMADVPIEKEVFINGALCVSCSGQCYMSLDMGTRSGNKGTCAQPCRLAYRLYEDGLPVKTDGDYLLSPKDLYSLYDIPELMRHGIDSFKIEGRMKRPEFVAFIVSEYRKAIDAAFEGKPFTPDTENTAKLFNRGFTQGHLFEKRGHELMNPVRPNHIGVPLGTVIAAKHNRFILSLERDLHKGDGIRILQKEDEGLVIQRMEQNNRPVIMAKAGSSVTIPYPGTIIAGSQAVLTSDTELLDKIRETYEKPSRYLPVKLTVHAKTGEPVSLEAQTNGKTFTVRDNTPIEKARKNTTDNAVWLAQLSRTKDTPYVFEPIVFDTDPDIFVPVSRINSLRRELTSAIYDAMTEKRTRRTLDPETKPVKKDFPRTVFAEVRTPGQKEAAEEFDTVVLSESDPDRRVYPRYSYAEDLKPAKTAFLNELAEMRVPSEKKYASQYFNLTNASAIREILRLGIDAAELSREVSDEDLIKIVQEYRAFDGCDPALIAFVYGRRDLMMTKYCAPNTYRTSTEKPKCGLCKKHFYELESKTKKYPLAFDDHCMMHILEAKPYNRITDLPFFLENGVKGFHLKFTDEKPEEVREILRKVFRILGKENV